MKKVIIIGCPGSGKSTFSISFSEILNIPLYHLDLIWNKPDKTTISREEFDIILKNIFKTKEWIMDGNYQRTLEIRIQEADTIILLDYPMEICLSGAENRVGIKRKDMPWVEDKLNEEFKQRIIDFNKDKLPKIYELFEKYKDKNIIIFKNREDAQDYLNDLKNSCKLIIK